MFTIISYNRSTSTTKTESLKQLAAACARKNPDKQYLIVDADPQETLTNWYQIAPDAPKPFDVVAFGKHESVLSRYDGVFYDTEGRPSQEVQNAILRAPDAHIFIPTPISKWKLYELSVKSAVDCMQAAQPFFMVFTLVSEQDLSSYRQYTKAWVADNLLDTHIPSLEILEEVATEGNLPQYMPKGHASRSALAIFDDTWLEIETKVLGQLGRGFKYENAIQDVI